ncbi:carnitine O-palmitoyltransferase 2, mitochondrial isoform X2 [Cimex lectularius]|nr:carnitine O-palmitoyltransferase 2, mitochondrial isoform X2 [Cimex lectularius]
MYLKDRKPLPINYNPFLVFIDGPKPEYNTQLLRGTNLLISSLRFMKSLRSNLLEPEVYHMNPKKSDTSFFRTVTGMLPSSVSWYGAYLFKAFPLDMVQYENLFNTSRIPEAGMDRLYHDADTKYIIVMKGGHFFKMNVLDESGDILDPQTIFTCLKYILNKDLSPAEHPVGILTTENRDKWADERRHLKNIGNADLLRTIDGAIFNLIFEDDEPTTEYAKLIQKYLHSDGVNRWFDKSFSMIVCKNGIAGLNFEHSWGDGVAILRYFQDIYKDSTEKPRVHPDAQCNNVSPETLVSQLVFKLDDKSKKAISDAKKKYNQVTSSLGIQLHECLHFGRNLCKVHKISPDLVMQLAFQIAHYKLSGRLVSTYESCSTAAFKHGRTETMRPCTVETAAVCKAFESSVKPGKLELLEMVKQCSKVHGNLIKEAAMGQGFDRHFFALHLIAQKRKKVPDMFADPLFSALNHYVLSTSTLSSDVVMLGAFGPVVQDGYGIGYSIWNERLGCIVSNYKENTDGPGLIRCIEQSLSEIHNILK